MKSYLRIFLKAWKMTFCSRKWMSSKKKKILSFLFLSSLLWHDRQQPAVEDSPPDARPRAILSFLTQIARALNWRARNGRAHAWTCRLVAGNRKRVACLPAMESSQRTCPRSLDETLIACVKWRFMCKLSIPGNSARTRGPRGWEIKQTTLFLLYHFTAVHVVLKCGLWWLKTSVSWENSRFLSSLLYDDIKLQLPRRCQEFRCPP